jgi:hypothetical protein
LCQEARSAPGNCRSQCVTCRCQYHTCGSRGGRVRACDRHVNIGRLPGLRAAFMWTQRSPTRTKLLAVALDELPATDFSVLIGGLCCAIRFALIDQSCGVCRVQRGYGRHLAQTSRLWVFHTETVTRCARLHRFVNVVNYDAGTGRHPLLSRISDDCANLNGNHRHNFAQHV